MSQNASDAEQSGAKTRTCSTCQRPCKNHIGPYGKDCKMDTSPDPLETLDHTTDENASGATGIDYMDVPKTLMEQLLLQMHDLNINIQSLVDGQTAIRNRMASADSGARQPSVTVNAERRMDSQHPSARGVVQPPAGLVHTHQETAENNSFQESSTVLPNGNRIENRAIRALKKGEFIELSSFLPLSDTPLSTEIEPNIDSTGKIIFRHKKQNKVLDSFSKWLSAWTNYEHLLVEQNPSLYSELASYRNFIHSCEKKFLWPAIHAYDSRFRAKLSTSKSMKYTSVDTDIYVSVFDVTAIKKDGKRCFRCRSEHHMVQECPFPATEQTVKKNDHQASKYNKYHEGREICRNFNIGKCTFPQCRRQHVCEACRGMEPAHKCPCRSGNNSHP